MLYPSSHQRSNGVSGHGPRSRSAIRRSTGSSPRLLLAVAVTLLLLASIVAPFAGIAGGGPTSSGAGDPAHAQAVPQVGARPGTYGLIDPSALQTHSPITISGNSQWTAANGVRYGAGTQANPYVIENWSITFATCNYTNGIYIHGNSTVYGIVRNVRIVNNCAAGGVGGGILLGTAIYPPNFNADRADNVVVTRDEIHTHGAGVTASYSTNNNTISYNAVFMNATINPAYAVTCQGGTYYCKIVGNFIDARSGQTCSGTSCTLLTQGIELGDYSSPTHYRKGAFALAAYNTVTNGTGTSVMNDPMYKAQIYNNLVYQNYPGRRVTYINGTPLPDRAIMVQGDSGGPGLANWSQVHDNVLFNYYHGIEVAGFAGWYWNNTVHDTADYGIYVNTNASAGKWAHWTTYNSFWNNHGYSTANGLYRISSNGYNTVLDMTSRPTNSSILPIFTNQDGRSVSAIQYAWSGTSLNVSYALAPNGSYRPAMTIYYISKNLASQNLSGSWWGSSLVVVLSQFTAGDIQYSITSSTNATFRATGLTLAAYYQVYRAGSPQSMLFTGMAGTLSFNVPAPASDSYEVRFSSAMPLPTVAISSPANGSYVTTSAPVVIWTASAPGSALQSVLLALDGGAPTNVTSVSSYALAGVSDGPHVVQVSATDVSGLTVSQSVDFTVDTLPPTVTILAPPNNAVVNTTGLLVTWNAADATSGVAEVLFQLDQGPSAVAQEESYSVVGLAPGTHKVSVTVVDNAGLAATAAVSFTVPVSASSPGSGGASTGVAAISYVSSQSVVDIEFTQAMNRTSVEQALEVAPQVAYAVQWIDDAHIRLVMSGPLVQGALYRVSVGPTARTDSGATLAYPILFQFLAGGTGGSAATIATNSILIILVVAALLVVNWATAGLLVMHYRKHTRRVRSALARLSAKYSGSVVVVYKRLAPGTHRRETTARRSSSEFALEPRASSEVKTIRSPFPRRNR